MPFLHTNFDHLLGNTIPLIVLLFLLISSRKDAWLAVGCIVVGSGGLLWIFWAFRSPRWGQWPDVWALFVPDCSRGSGTPCNSHHDRGLGGFDLRWDDAEWGYSTMAIKYLVGRTPLRLVGRWFGGVLALETESSMKDHRVKNDSLQYR